MLAPAARNSSATTSRNLQQPPSADSFEAFLADIRMAESLCDDNGQETPGCFQKALITVL